MPAGGVLFALVLLLAVVAPLVLYAIVSAEADDTERMDRSAAERRVRRDAESDTTGGAAGDSDPWGDDDDDPWGDRDDDRNGWN